MKLAIIGTAGRGFDGTKVTPNFYNQLKEVIFSFISKHSITSLISGGAAVSDHLAVVLYNTDVVKDLTLALPCEFNMDKGKFADNGSRDIRGNHGGTANYYHKIFSEKVGIDSLQEVEDSIIKGAEVIVKNGFFARNEVVADLSSILIAFTYGDRELVKDGGTSHTTGLFIEKNGNDNAYHCDLNTMEVFKNAIIN